MSKVAEKYLKVEPWRIVETGFHKDRNRISESVFSLANEYHGVRGFAEEGISSETLRGSYFNGIYENAKKINETAYKGIVKRGHFMVNSVDWLKTQIVIDGETLDTARADIEDYERALDMRSGILTRSFVWMLKGGTSVKLSFERFLSMTKCERGYQRITLTSTEDVRAEVTLSLDFNVLHWGKDCYWERIHAEASGEGAAIVCGTLTTGQRVASAMSVDAPAEGEKEYFDDGLTCGIRYALTLNKGKSAVFTRFVSNFAARNGENCPDLAESRAAAFAQRSEGYEAAKENNKRYWKGFWDKTDIEIKGDPENQQGIRFCIFQLQQTYHGMHPKNNIGAKGLTGEAYSGHAFWDTETYCLPYYLFNNLTAAKDLLLFRYHTLEQARKRAIELDCRGACYPIATLNGNEACDLWQHASLQLQPSTAVAYGIRHYENVSHDTGFVADYGLEMLIEISRFLLSRGQWNASKEYFGYYCVMGPDEFQMMVNHNTYTNFMAKKTFEYTLEKIEEIRIKYPDKYNKVIQKTNFDSREAVAFAEAAQKMLILFDPATKLYEQHKGFFDLPHIDIKAIPAEDFPLYYHWSYDRIYRNDMIKQPDVLMFMLLYSGDFSYECKKANYEYYEPRCIHESSLSPSVHSIIAAELGKKKEALDFFAFATRMDLDDYNRNASEGLHTTSIAAAWMNIVYGFGGLRSDGKVIRLSPTIPGIWEGYSFRVSVSGETVLAEVDKKGVTLTKDTDNPLELLLYGEPVTLRRTLCAEGRV